MYPIPSAIGLKFWSGYNKKRVHMIIEPAFFVIYFCFFFQIPNIKAVIRDPINIASI